MLYSLTRSPPSDPRVALNRLSKSNLRRAQNPYPLPAGDFDSPQLSSFWIQDGNVKWHALENSGLSLLDRCNQSFEGALPSDQNVISLLFECQGIRRHVTSAWIVTPCFFDWGGSLLLCVYSTEGIDSTWQRCTHSGGNFQQSFTSAW